MTQESPPTAIVEKKPYPSLVSIVSVLVIILLVLAFIFGKTVQFYASFLFWFYSFTTSMWISVIMLGVFQTLLMLPIRVVNLFKSANTEEFKTTIEKTERQEEQQFLIKKHAKRGTPIFLWYTVSFFIQTISYISMGRLFLIDFYSQPLNPDLLYSWVPYPEYPIQGIIFKIPYIWPTDTVNLGWRAVLTAWLVIIGLRILVYIFRYFARQLRKPNPNQVDTPQKKVIDRAMNFWNGSFLLLMIGSFFLMRNFPTGLEIKLFMGSVAVPNIKLNTITALATFFTIVWLDYSKMKKKSVLARQQEISEDIIHQTERQRFRDSFRNGGFLGLGAFFITNHIPAAFELSIFTLEIISWLAPFTIDKIILRAKQPTTPTTPPSISTPEPTAPDNKSTQEKPPKSLDTIHNAPSPVKS